MSCISPSSRHLLQVDAVFGAGPSGPNWHDVLGKLGVVRAGGGDTSSSGADGTAASSKAAVAAITPATIAAHVAPFAAAEEAALRGSSGRERAFSLALLLSTLLNDQAFLRVRAVIAEHHADIERVISGSAKRRHVAGRGANFAYAFVEPGTPDYTALMTLFRGPVLARAAALGQLLTVLERFVATETACRMVFKPGLLNVRLERPLALALEDGELSPAVLDEARRLVLLQVGGGQQG